MEYSSECREGDWVMHRLLQMFPIQVATEGPVSFHPQMHCFSCSCVLTRLGYCPLIWPLGQLSPSHILQMFQTTTPTFLDHGPCWLRLLGAVVQRHQEGASSGRLVYPNSPMSRFSDNHGTWLESTCCHCTLWKLSRTRSAHCLEFHAGWMFGYKYTK